MRCALLALIALMVAIVPNAVAAVTAPEPPFTDASPKWSPDGSSIAFVRAGVVHLVRARGGGLQSTETRPLDMSRYSVPWFAWAPQSSVLGVLAGDFRREQLFTTDGRISRSVSSSLCTSPSWSSDGSLLAYPSFYNDPCGNARFAAVNRNGETVLEVEGANPRFSPDGRYIAFHRDSSRSTHVLDLASGITRKVLPVGDEVFWSPDSSRLAVVDEGPSSVPEPPLELTVYLVDPAGTNAQTLGVLNRVLSGYAPSHYRSAPTWSPDGRQLVYNAPDGIRVVSSDGSGARIVGHGVLQGWSPRNQELLVLQRGRVEVLGLTRKRRFLGYGFTASWSPDGESAVFAGSWRCGPRQGIWTASRTGANRRRLTNACPLTEADGKGHIRGTRWRDAVYGYGRDDSVLVKGGGIDTVVCGEGFDKVVADRRDRVAPDCERVSRR